MDLMISWLQTLYTVLGLDIQVTAGDVFAIISILFLLITASAFLFSKKPAPPVEKQPTPPEHEEEIARVGVEVAEEEEGPLETEEIVEIEEVKVPEISWRERLKRGLSQSRKEIWGKVTSLVVSGKLDEEKLEEIEELLYGADIGPATVQELIEKLEEKAKSEEMDAASLKLFLFEFLKNKMNSFHENIPQELITFDKDKALKVPRVIMVVGVNGAGKTTTIGKLATKLTRLGAQVVVGACDTFRAAAVDQLEVWCERAGADMIRAKEGADPSGVAYEAVQKARSMGADYCILDTAGRLHTKGNLMEELKKNKRVIGKLDDTAPHHVLLVIDAITGQNAMRQAEEFNKCLDLTGLVFTKCDGSSKAGNAVAIVQQLKIPIVYIGVGETVDDINPFNLDEYLKALLDI
ncbi:MAG: signal recognition particle-docking protein FtsY [Bacteriovoracia bacterium]